MVETVKDPKRPNILIIDDDKQINSVLSQILCDEFNVYATDSVIEGLEIARRISPFLAMIDLRMPEASGIQVLKEMRIINPDIRVMIMSAYGEVKSVVEIFKEGAIDFLAKPFNFNDLLDNIRRLASVAALEQPDLVNSTKIIRGNPGYIRGVGPFIPVDCSALPESLIESELFGYEKGAFTGAHASKKGLFESADSGTLFIDEIGNLPLHIQSKLLRIIQDHKVIRLGAKGYEPVSLSMRVIAATNADLKEESEKGGFRLDLYYRLNVATITLPPLRDRHGDIPLLANYFLAKCNQEFHRTTGITDEAMNLLNDYQWPGNIRELENVIKSAYLISDEQILPSHLPKIIDTRSKP